MDGVEAMDHMVNMLREHVPDSTRIHYVITRGGEAPNVVPAFGMFPGGMVGGVGFGGGGAMGAAGGGR